MCCGQGSPTSTFNPAISAASSSQSGGTVNTRTVLIPASPISAKSRSTTADSGNGAPWLPIREGAVGDALDEMLALAGEEELAADPDRRGRLDRRGRHQSSGCGNLVAVDQGHP